MENATEALKMGAAVLMFVLALSVSLNAFGEARQTSQILLNYKDKEYNYTYVEDNGTTSRTVSAESIIPSIYKAYKENFKIIFKKSPDEALEIYKKKGKSICYIDLQKESLANDSQKEIFINSLWNLDKSFILAIIFIKAILYGKNRCSNWDEINNKFFNNEINLHEEGLYDIIKGKQFTEYLGVYYQNEVSGITESSNVNDPEKRVITYIQNN